MKIADARPQILKRINVKVTARDLAKKIQPSVNRSKTLKAAERTLSGVNGRWRPTAVYQWFEFQPSAADKSGCIIQSSGPALEINFGYSINFLKPARHALVAVYTAGGELEQAGLEASRAGNHLAAYFIDLIGLIVLEKTGERLKAVARDKAIETGCGVSPFLSPGSVHGWDLAEQIKLCSVLPLEKIKVTLREDAVLSPFKSLSCLIGLGTGYDTVDVGSTCQVCSRRHECEMKKTFNH